MKHIGSILFSLCLLLLVGCADEIGPYDPGDSAPAPVFTMTALIDGDSAHMVAGANGYRMTTNRTPDTSIVGGSVLSGEMHDPDCPGCGPEMRIALIHRPQTPAGALVDSALQPGIVVMNPPIDNTPILSKTLSFEYVGPTGPTGPNAVLWDFGDGNTGQGTIVQHTYDIGPGTPFFTQVICTVMGPGGCIGTHANVINLNASQFFEVNVQQTGASPTVQVDVQPKIINGGNIIIDMGDGSPPQPSWNVTHTYQTNGVFNITVLFSAIDSTNFFVYERPITIGSTPGFCIAPFIYEKVSNSPPTPARSREIAIRYKDGQGNEYVSSPILGGQTQQVELTNYTAFKENEHGDMVYVVEMETDCWLYEVNGTDSIRLEQGVFQWGFPY